jgi:dinuclear metal center YbgI/SA1388 family protein
MTKTVADVIAVMDELYPPFSAASWDRVGLVMGEPAAKVERILFMVDVVPQTAHQAIDIGAQMIVAHHPLMLRGFSSVAPTTFTGRIVHDLIRAGVALHVAHTNADIAPDGVNEALADLFDLTDRRPVTPDLLGRLGTLPEPVTLRHLTERVCRLLPETRWGVRAAGNPDREITRLAVVGGSGSDALQHAQSAEADAILTSDIKHHYASDVVASAGPAIIEASHWATEWPWLPRVAGLLRERLEVETIVSELSTDPWSMHVCGGE